MLRAKGTGAEEIAWIEEPIATDDLAGGNARIAAWGRGKISSATRRDFNGVEADFRQALQARAVISSCRYCKDRRASRVGLERRALPAMASDVVSPCHEVECAFCWRPTPTAHWLEYVDWGDAICRAIKIVDAWKSSQIARAPSRMGRRRQSNIPDES